MANNISSDAVEDSNLCSGDVEDSKISVDAVQDDAMNEEVINKETDKKAKGVPHSDIGTEPQGDRQDHEFDPECMEIKVTNIDPDFAERTLANTLNQHFKTSMANNISSDAVEVSNLCSVDVEDSKISVDAVQDDAMNEEVINKDVALPFDLAADHYDIMIIYDHENVTERMKAENLKKFLIAKCKPDTKVLLMADPYFEEATDTFDTFGVWKWEMALDKCSLFFLLISAQFCKTFYQTMKSRMNDPNKMWSVISLHTKNLEYTTPDGLGDVTRIDIKDDMIGDEWDITDEKLNVDAIIPPKRRFEKILQRIEKGKTMRKERQEVLENKRKKYKEDVLHERRERALKEKAQEEEWQRVREIKVAEASAKKKQMTKAEPELDDEADADANPSKEEKDKDLTLHSVLKRRKIIDEDIGGDMAHEKAASEKTDMTVASATVNDKKAKGVPHSDIGTEPQGDRQDHEFDPECMEIKVTNIDPDFAERTLANTKVCTILETCSYNQ